MNDIDVSIIMINYKKNKMTVDAIDSIISKSHLFTYEIIVVDNSNDTNEFEMLKSFVDDKARCINANANLGFGKGNNLGAKFANGKYLYFINNDISLINNAIYELFKFMESNSYCGIAGSNLYTIDKEPNHSFSKNMITIKQFKKNNSLLSIFNRNSLLRTDFNFTDKPLKIGGYVVGASLMISRDTFNYLGGFDKDIFMYAEESLLCYRLIKECKLDIYNIPSSKIIHFEGASFKNDQNIITEFHANSFINGNFIYFSKVFSQREAIKFLKCAIRIYKKKMILAKITKKRNPQSYINLVNACKIKLREVSK